MHANSPTTLRRGRRRISRWGIAFCAGYALFIAGCFATVALGNFDLKSRALLNTVPFALQAAFAYKLGLSELFAPLPWPVVDALLALPVFICLYPLGAAFSRG
jgi:hypothetical protein